MPVVPLWLGVLGRDRLNRSPIALAAVSRIAEGAGRELTSGQNACVVLILALLTVVIPMALRYSPRRPPPLRIRRSSSSLVSPLRKHQRHKSADQQLLDYGV